VRNCPSDREKLLKFEAEDQEFEKILRSLFTTTRTIYSNSERSEQFLVINWNKKIKLEKILELENMQEKLEKSLFVVI
jgi:hypothetical protein